MKRKSLAILLVLTLVLGLVPVNVFAGHVPGRIQSATFNGNDIAGSFKQIDTPSGALDGVDFPLSGILDGITTLNLPVSDVDGGKGLFDIELFGGVDEPVVLRYLSATDAHLLEENANFTVATQLGADFDSQTLNTGDVIVVVTGTIVDGQNADDVPISFAAFEINIVTPSATGQQSIQGESALFDVVVNMDVPANLNFELNPFQVGVGIVNSDTARYDNQLVKHEFVLRNTTPDVPVFAGFDLEVTGREGVTFVSDRDELNRDDINEEAKDIFFAALAANCVTDDSVFISDNVELVATNRVATASDALVPFLPNDDTTDDDAYASFAFVLEANGAEDAGNEAAFRFYAELNTYAGWLAGDVAVEGIYTLSALRPATVDGLELSEDGHRLLAAIESDEEDKNENGGSNGGGTPPPTYITQTSTISRPRHSSANPLVLEFAPGGPATVQVAANVGNLTGNPWASPTDFTWNAGTGVLTITRVPGASTVVARVGDITVTVNLT